MINYVNFVPALQKLYPNVVRTVGETAYDAEGNEVVYDKDAVEASVNANQYKQQRALEYPSLPEQLDMLYHDKINNTNIWLETIQAVKDKYPKS